MVWLHGGGFSSGTANEEGYDGEALSRSGNVVEIPEGVRHWHGAAPDSWFSQIVIYDSHYTSPDGAAEELVEDAYYDSLETEEYAGHVPSPDSGLMFPRAAEAVDLDTFNGPIYLSSLLEGDNVADAPGLHYVVFEPGVINNWHTHEGGQILIATDGIGYHQMEGEPVEVLYPGDVALCPPGVKHWHGGSAGTRFAHIAANTNLELTGLEWFDRLTDEEYRQLPAEKAGETRE